MVAAGTLYRQALLPGTFKYLLSATSPCIEMSIATVNVNNQPDAGTDGNTTVCESVHVNSGLFSLVQVKTQAEHGPD
jgi:hypothetical protein